MYDPYENIEDLLFDWPKKLAKFLKNIGVIILFLGGLSAFVAVIYAFPVISVFLIGLSLTVLLGIEQGKIWFKMIFLGKEP